MVDPALHAGVELGEADLSPLPGGVAFAKAAAGLYDLARLDPPLRRVDDKTQPGDATSHRQRLRAILVELQPQSGEPVADGGFSLPQCCLGVRKQREVIDVTQIGTAAEFLADEPVEGMQIAIRQELRREIADGQAARPAQGQQVVTGKERRRVLLIEHAGAAGENDPHQSERGRVVDLPRQRLQQNGVIDGRKVLDDIQAQHIRESAGEVLQAGNPCTLRMSQEDSSNRHDDLIILARCFDLLAWLVPKSETFPKLHRHTVVQRLVDSALDFQELLFSACRKPTANSTSYASTCALRITGNGSTTGGTSTSTARWPNSVGCSAAG